MRLLRRLLQSSTGTGVASKSQLTGSQESTSRLVSKTLARSSLDEKIATHKAAGCYAASLALIARTLEATQNDAALISARASTLWAWGRFREARNEFLRAEALGAREPGDLLQMGMACLYVGDLSGAEARMRELTTVQETSAQNHFWLGTVLKAQRRIADAVVSYERSLDLYPDFVDCLMHLSACRAAENDLRGAETLLRRAVAVDPDRADAWNELGMILGRQDRYRDALEAFQRAARLEVVRGEDVSSFINLAINARDAGQTTEALELYENNLAQRPSADGHFSYAVALLTAGRLSEGWRHFGFRWLKEPSLSLRPRFGRPVWAGQALRGRTILLRAEQGVGDTIQFIRYAPMLKALGATVQLGVFTGLEDLFRGVDGVDQVLGPDDPVSNFDFYVHMMSLPDVFGTGLESIPDEVPYLHAEPARCERWAQELRGDPRLAVGIVWAGSPSHVRDRYRSLSLRQLAPLAEVDGVRWISLQKGEAAREAEVAPSGLPLVNLGPALKDFRDTAAVIDQLDLVLCVDTAVAHLAGALGKPVWVMLPKPADWRWLEGREDSPWYPTMRLFRQSRRGEWADVVERVKVALQERLGDGASAAGPTKDRRPQVLQSPVGAVPSRVPGHRPGLSGLAECRYGILQYLPDQPSIGDALGWYGEYLQPQLDLLARLIRPGATVMEAGAGVGEHALFLAVTVGEEGHVFLYEPRPVVKRILQQNLAANRVTNITLMRRTLGATGEAADNAAETLDELQLERLDWLKVNGSVPALDILDGGPDTLWRLRPLLFLAAGDEPALTALASRVKEFSYRCWRMETALFNPENFNRREADIFDGHTALALLAIPEEIDVDISLSGCVEIS